MDIDRLSALCLDISTEWQDIQLTYKNRKGKEKAIQIPLIYTGSNGIYVFLSEKQKADTKEIYDQIEKIFTIRGDGLYLFFFCESEDVEENEADKENEVSAWYYDSVKHKFLELENLYDAFDTFYYNHYIPQAELPYYKFDSASDYFEVQEVKIERQIDTDDDDIRYIRPVVSSSKLKLIEEKLDEMLVSGRKEGKYTYYPDGTMTVNKIVKSVDSWKRPWESYMSQSTYDYPCMEEEGDKTMLMTALGGWFGLHKFRDKKFFQGLLYLISCGGCCLFYVIDMISVATGNYFRTNSRYYRESSGKVEREKTKVYNRPVKNKKLLLLIPIMTLLTSLLLTKVYLPVYEAGSEAISGAIQKIYSEKAVEDNDLPGLNGFSSEDLEEYFSTIEAETETGLNESEN